MPNLKGLLDSANRGEKLVVTRYHADWLELPPDLQQYTPEAIQFVADALAGKFKHPRPGRFSPSSLGMCQRRLVFGYEGAPQAGEDLDASDLMGLGTWGHLRWQAEGLSQGYMLEGEVWVHDPDLRTGGSMDANLQDNSVFELKTTRTKLYNKFVVQDQAPKWEHQLQFGAYALISGRTWGSIVYEDRANGSFHEFRVEMSGELEKAVLREIGELNAWLEKERRPLILDDCEMRTGYVYRSCPYRKYCIEENREGR